MSKAEKSENYENGAVKVILRILAGIVAVIVVLFLLCIFFVKSNFSIADYSMQVANDKNSFVLPNGSLYIAHHIVPYSKNNEISAGSTVVFIDEQGTQKPGYISGFTTADNDMTIYTIDTTAGVSQEVEAVQIVKTVSFYIPYLGYIIDFIVTPLGLICCVAVPLFILLVVEIINLIRLPKSLKKQEEEGMKQELLQIAQTQGGDVVEKSNVSVQSHYRPSPITVSSHLSAFDKAQKPIKPPIKPLQPPIFDNMIEDVSAEVELVNKKEIRTPVSYAKPKEIIETKKSKSETTREFCLPIKNGNTKTDLKGFSADLKEESPNHFLIDGVDIKVQPDNIKLSTSQNAQGRDISITVTKDYTNVSIAGRGEQDEIDFALFRDEADDEQKVIIRKRSK